MNPNKNNSTLAKNFDFTRYLRLVKREKWVIAILFILSFAAWMVLAFKFGPKSIYETNALLQFEDRRDLTQMDSRGRPENDAKLGLLMSRNFLGKVVDKLSLGFVIYDLERREVVDSISLSPKYRTGAYSLVKEDDRLVLYYSNDAEDIKDEKVVELPTWQEAFVKYDGFVLKVKDDYWQDHKKLEFYLIKRERAIEELRSMLTPEWGNRTHTLLQVKIKGNDRFFIAKILNTLIDEFVQQNLNLKKYHTREVLDILTEQLKTAKAELDEKTEALKRFRQKNPWVGLNPGTNSIVGQLSDMEVRKVKIQDAKDELQSLLSRLQGAQGEQRYPLLNEILAFLQAQGVATVPALQTELTNLLDERERLLREYRTPRHKLVIENSEKLSNLDRKIVLTANNEFAQYIKELTHLDSKIKEGSFKIRSLPEKELQLAELQQKKTIAEEVYSSLLVRHNQAMIADAVEVSDVIVLDSAVVPEAGSRMKIILTYILVGIVVGLAFGFGYVFVKDLFNKTVFTADELERIIPIKVMAKIPIIGNEKDFEYENFEEGVRIDPKLVTADYSPTPVGEAYRNLRTQLLFGDESKKVKSIFITSLNPNEGKSLNASNLAITFAQQKLPTLLIDGDLRRGVLHHSFACKKRPGLSDFLYSPADINDENIRKVIQQTHIPNLYLLSAGRPIPNPSEILGSQRSKEVIEFLASRFGFLIIDTPPIMVTSDAVIISQYVDTGLFVVRAGVTNMAHVKEKIFEYGDFSNKISGTVLNFSEYDVSTENYKYSYYNY
ncbi:MAG TPA: polysaccharide biosynthesis tyrosine autokinase [Caldithrix abyssi]|uniref:Polysaccharide biosynthesis tyrosine autokinase n=1 Tax=Caldithrix abyssi TaxID=187145 RepID=A0A7V4U1L9_CALAY|nr:polysaccharide biosynthesis tyrosine autokinase [Caldithrix abyssi]